MELFTPTTGNLKHWTIFAVYIILIQYACSQTSTAAPNTTFSTVSSLQSTSTSPLPNVSTITQTSNNPDISSLPQTSTPLMQTSSSIPPPPYSSSLEVPGYDSLDHALRPVFTMATFFLEQMVHPRDLTARGLTNVTDFDSLFDTWQRDPTAWLRYYIGFLLCACAGVTFALCLLVVGLTLPCCRAAGCCGGRASTIDTKYSQATRYGCGVALLVVMVFIALGAMVMVTVAVRLHQNLKDEGKVSDRSTVVGSVLIDSVKRVDGYLSNTRQQVTNVTLGEFDKTYESVVSQLDGIPAELFTALDNRTDVTTSYRKLEEATSTFSHLNVSTHGARAELEVLQTSQEELNELYLKIENNSAIINSLCSPKEICNNVTLSPSILSFGSNYTGLSIDELKYFADVFINSSRAAQNGVSVLNSSDYWNLKSIFEQLLQQHISGIKNQTADLRIEIEKYNKDLEQEISKLDLQPATTYIQGTIKPNLDYYGSKIAFGVLVSLACVLCLIFLIAIIGVIIGCFCRRGVDAYIDCEPCSRKLGANFLLGVTAVIFIVGWLLSLLATVLLTAGGVAQVEMCRPLLSSNFNQSKVVDFYDTLLTGYIQSQTNISGMSVKDVNEKCRSDSSFYKAFNLEAMGYNISGLINLETLRNELEKMSNITFLIEANLGISNFSADLQAMQTEINGISFTNYLQTLQQPLSLESLSNFSSQLDLLGISLNDPNSTDIRELVNRTRDQLNNASIIVKSMNETRKSAFVQFFNINNTFSAQRTVFSDVLFSLENGQIVLNNQTVGGDTVSVALRLISERIYDTILTYSTSTSEALRNQVGRCRELHTVLSNALNVVCYHVVHNLNAYWFALGWCLVLFIPSLVLSLKLTTVYRKTQPRELKFDAFDDPTSPYAGYSSTSLSARDYSASGGAEPKLAGDDSVLLRPLDKHDHNGRLLRTNEFDNPMYDNTGDDDVIRGVQGGEQELRIPRLTVIRPMHMSGVEHVKDGDRKRAPGVNSPPGYEETLYEGLVHRGSGYHRNEMVTNGYGNHGYSAASGASRAGATYNEQGGGYASINRAYRRASQDTTPTNVYPSRVAPK